MKIMAGVKAKELSQVQASELMGLGYRQAKRVWRCYQDQGDAGLVHRLRGKPGLRCKPAALRTEVLKFCAQDRYQDFGPTLMAEELKKEGLSSITIRRRWLWLGKRPCGDDANNTGNGGAQTILGAGSPGWLTATGLKAAPSAY
jgi:hypothetical protein